ncbi:MAG: ferredoxin family protein [Myxococcota bacterium]
MTYVITQPCEGVCDTACVDVCPVDCIHGPIQVDNRGEEVKTIKDLTGLQLFINPDECIDCGACEPECPVSAIYEESELPDSMAKYLDLNQKFFE